MLSGGLDLILLLTEGRNPAVKSQATDRAFRIGQKEVLIGDGTGAEKLRTDMRADELLEFVKLDLSDVV